MLVKRTILKIHTPSFCILGHILCPRTMHAAAFQSRSMHVHLGNATRHILDPLRDGFLSAKIPPRAGFEKFKPPSRQKKQGGSLE